MEACFRAHAAQIDANIAERLHAVDTAISEVALPLDSAPHSFTIVLFFLFPIFLNKSHVFQLPLVFSE